MKQTIPLLSTFFSLVSSAGAQLSHRSNPDIQWDVQIKSVRQGNGVFLSPDEEMLVASTNLGFVSAFGARDGSEIFQFAYDPKTTAIEFITSDSGVAFSADYMVYSVLVNKDSASPLTRVVALALDGEQLWVSPNLKGISPGTPVVSDDGAYIFLTHNSFDGTIGHFTIIDGATGDVFFTQINESAPFAPLGIFHSPAEGYYDGGENNRNDVLVWSVQPMPNDSSVGPGATFAFQFPIGFAGSDNDLAYTQLGDEVKDFQTIQKPIFTDDGRSMYWGTSRSQFRCWLGEEGQNRFRFGRARTATVGFSRGTPPMQAVFAAPALSKDPVNRFVFGGTAANEFVKMAGDFADDIMVLTGALVMSTAHVSPDDAYVYFLEADGTLHQANTMDISDRWVLDVGAATEGEFALNSDGTMLYVGDASGFIQAFRVGDVPTEAPSTAPSSLPTMALSASPTMVATPEPTPAATIVSTQSPTLSPVISLTATGQPTADNQNPPTRGPTSGASYHVGATVFLLALLPLFGL